LPWRVLPFGALELLITGGSRKLDHRVTGFNLALPNIPWHCQAQVWSSDTCQT
jgi:hypothetical protein